jgi:8-oxo-dGTP pyrophosphatase MutT (NUDIX family)
MSSIIGAGVFLTYNNSVLLVHQKISKLWGFPKGCKEPQEELCDCWRRELHEETGMVVLPRCRIKKKRFVTLRYYITLVEALEEPIIAPKTSNEISEVRWVPIDQVYRYRLNAVTRNTLQKFKKSPKSPKHSDSRSWRSV